MRRVTASLTTLSLLALPLAASVVAGPAAAGAATASAACRTPVVGPNDAAGQSVVDGVRAGRHDTQHFDRVVFDLTDVPGYQVQRVRRVLADPSGEPVTLRGQSFLTVRLDPAVAHDSQGQPTAPRRLLRSFTQLREVRQVGDNEGVVTYGLGLAGAGDFRVLTLTAPDRLVVDVGHPGTHPFDCAAGAVKVFLATPDATAAAVTRRVPATAPGRGALTAMFAGPADFDVPAGLSFVNSGATGFADLSISQGIARVRLTGGCASGGSTFTIADEIVPTLKQFATVDFVKILDPQGRTEQPTGRVDSIPTCLEP
jgi:hypothetical protein